MNGWKVGAALGLAAAAVSAALATTAGATSGPPQIFDVDVSAAPVRSSSSVTAAVPLAVDSGAAFSRVQLNSQPSAIGTAAPGYLPLAEAAPVLFGLPEPPASTACYSYFPGQPDEASCGGPAQGTGGLNTAAASGHTASSGDARDPTQLRAVASVRASQVGATSDISVPFSIGQAASAAAAGADGDRMAAGASTAVSDIVAAGVLTIENVSSSVSGALGGAPGTAAQQATLAVSGATVAGIPVTIDNDGVRVADQRAPGPFGASTQEQVNAALAAAGLQVRTVPGAEPVASPDGTKVEVESGGLLISFRDPQGATASTVTIGGSVLRMQGFRNPPGRSVDVVPVATSPGLRVGAGGEADATPSPAPPPPPHPGATSPAPALQSFVRTSAASGWRIPYPPFALLSLALPVLAGSRRLLLTWR